MVTDWSCHMDWDVFRCGAVRVRLHDPLGSNVVCGIGQTLVDSSELGVRSGLVSVVPHDGSSGVAGLASGWIRHSGDTVDTLSGSIGAQCRVVYSLLWTSHAGLGLCGDRAPLVCDFGHIDHVLAIKSDSWFLVGSLYSLDHLCRGA